MAAFQLLRPAELRGGVEACRVGRTVHMGASINKGPQNRPKYIMVLIIGTTKMGPLICGNSHMSYECMGYGGITDI